MPTVATTADRDIELLAIRFARLQAEHDQRSDCHAKQRSRDAIRSWGERVPAALTGNAQLEARDQRSLNRVPAPAGFLNLFQQEVTSGSDS